MQSSTRVLRNQTVTQEEALVDGSTLLIDPDALRDRLEQVQGDEVLVGASVVIPGVDHTTQETGGPHDGKAPIPSGAPETAIDPTDDARSGAQVMLDEAHKHSLAIVADAEAQRDSILLEARTEGYEDGYQAGIAQGEVTVNKGVAIVEEMARRLVREEARMAQALEGRLAHLAVAIARKVIRRELESSTSDVEELVSAALHHFAEDEKLILRLNPVDAAHLKASGGELATLFDAGGSVKVIEDRRVSRGGCVVESPSAQLDARPEVQLERVAELFEVESSNGSGAQVGSAEDELSDLGGDSYGGEGDV